MGSTVFVMDAGTAAKRPTHKVGAANYTAGKRRYSLVVDCVPVVCDSFPADVSSNRDHSTAAGCIGDQLVHYEHRKAKTTV